MTQLPSNPLADIIRQRITDRMAKRSRIGELIAQTRATATPAQVEQRTNPRLSLEELEGLSQSELGQRLQSAGPEDTRSGFVKFFDLLDLPRNVLANAIIRPAMDSKAVAAKRTGTFGLPQVTFSDALDAMGMEPGFARGALGFVGDVAFDPLTYLGNAASHAAKLGLKAGSVGVRKSSMKIMDKTLAAVARGTPFDASKLSGRLKGMEGVIGRAARPEVIAAAKRAGKTEPEIQTMLREAILGRTRLPGQFGGRSVIQLTPEEIAVRITSGGTFTAEQLMDPRIASIVKQSDDLLAKAAKSETLSGPSLTGDLTEEVAQIARDIIGKDRISIPVPGAKPLAVSSFQPGSLARKVGTDPGIASFLKREGRTKGMELRVPFTDTGIKLFERDARMKALQELDDASHFAREIGDVGTAYPDTLLHKVSTAIRGDTAPSQTPAYRTALANGMAKVDRGMQQYFGAGNRESMFGRQAKISDNTANAANAVAHSMRIDFDRSLDKLVENVSPEEAESIRNTIFAKLEIGLGQAKDPDGHAIFGAVGDIDFSKASAQTASAVAKQIRDAKLAAIDAGRGHGWDEIFDHVADSMESGNWFNPRINEYVGRMQGVYQAIDESAVKGGIWERGLGNFASHTLTDEAAAAIKQQKLANKVLKHGSPAEARILSEQGFEKHRTTNRYLWHDEDGTLQNIYAFQLDDPMIAKKVATAVEQGRVPKYGYQSSAFHTNKIADSGSFASLLGPTWKGRMMDNNPANALASNYRQLQRAKIGRDFASYAHNFARSVDEKSFHKLLSESKVEEMQGQNAYRILADGIKDVNGKVIGNRGDLIRRVNIAADHPLYKNLGEGISHFFDDRVATRIEDYASYYNDPAKITNFLSIADGITSQLRTWTLAHPSWLLTNISSNAISAALMGATPKDVPLFTTAHRLYGRYQGIIKEGGSNLNEFLDETVQIGQRTFSNRELITVAEQTGVLEQGRIVRQIANTIGNSTQMLRDTAMKPSGPAASLAGRFGQVYTKGMAKWFLFNHSVEQRQRLWSMMTRLEKGDNLQQAALETVRHHYDYGDMTRFENDFMRKILYFYPWVRNNTPFMLTKLFEDPKWVAAFPKLKVALEDTIAEEDRIPESQRPSWFKNQLGTQIGSKTGILLPMLTQFQDVAEVGQALTGKREDIKEFLHYLTSQVNPLMQLPFELAAGREFFTGREIGDPDTGAMSVPDFLSGQIRPWREGTRLKQLIESGTDRGLTPVQRVAEVAGRGIVGGRFQSMDPERAVIGNVAALADDAAKVRNQINVAMRDGDKQRAIRLTIKLESLWRQILEMDPESDRVPKQVKERLLAPTGQAGSVPAA